MSSTSIIELPAAELKNGTLAFESSTALKDALGFGAFLLQIPAGFNIAPGLDLCQNFYKSADDDTDLYRGHRDASHPESSLGYEDRPDQVEQLQIESHLWRKYFPSEVTGTLEPMRDLTLTTLQELLRLAGVPQGDWELVTGGAAAGTNLCYTTVNHYRSELERRVGIVEHTDSGFITVIYADQPGFEIYVDGEWYPVRERPGYFIVNTGDAFEVLTRNLPGAVGAVLHRVVATHPERRQLDRSSFTVYMGPRFDMTLYQYTNDTELQEYQSFRDFSVDKAARMGYEFHSRV